MSKKMSRPKIVYNIQEILSRKISNLDKIMLIKCLIQKNFELTKADDKKIFYPETYDCF